MLGVDARRVLGEHERIKFSIINVKITVSNRKKNFSPLYQLIKKLSTDKVKHKKYEVKNESKKINFFLANSRGKICIPLMRDARKARSYSLEARTKTKG